MDRIGADKMTTFEIIALLFFILLLGIVLGVVIAFRLLGVQKQADEIDKNEWEEEDFL